jgi:hypothetical protein
MRRFNNENLPSRREAGVVLTIVLWLFNVALLAQPDNSNVPLIPYQSVPNFLKYSPEMNLGEALGVAVNSKGHLMLLNHPGSANSGGPVYGNATSQLLEFDQNGRFIREIGQNVYALAYSHSIRYDRYDNLWLVDKGAHSAIKFDPAGYVTMNLGRRPEGFDEYEHVEPEDVVQPMLLGMLMTIFISVTATSIRAL